MPVPQYADQDRIPPPRNGVVSTYWVVEHEDGYQIGSDRVDETTARWYLAECVDKKRRKKCKVVRYDLHRSELPTR